MATRPPRDMLKEDLELLPDLSFWYGLSFIELVNLPNWVLRMYAQALSRLKAELEIVHNRAASFAHMKKSAQREIMSELNRRVREGREPRKIDKSGMKGAIAGIGLAFIDECAKKETD